MSSPEVVDAPTKRVKSNDGIDTTTTEGSKNKSKKGAEVKVYTIDMSNTGQGESDMVLGKNKTGMEVKVYPVDMPDLQPTVIVV